MESLGVNKQGLEKFSSKEAVEQIIFPVNVVYDVKEEDIESLLTSAFEGGSNYWYRVEKKVNGREDKAKGCVYLSDYVLHGKGLIVSDFFGADKGDKVEKELTINQIQYGLQRMALKYPSHFRDIISDNCDAITGDVFLQCCLYGEIIYS